MFSVTLVLLGAVAFAGLRRPHWGVALFLALLPLEAVLPEGLIGSRALFGSPLAALGGAAIAGCLIGLLVDGRLQQGAGVNRATVLGLMFIGWIWFVHPAAWSASDGRNWVFTLGQLWVLALAAGAALDTEDKHLFAMTTFALACFVSALVATSTGAIADVWDEGVRESGLGTGSNAAARQYAVGIVFMLFLYLKSTRMWLRVSTLAAAAVLFVGVVFTQSRAGLILALVASVALPLASVRKKVAGTVVGGLVLASIVLMLLPEGAVGSTTRRFNDDAPNFGNRYDSVTENIRFRLWDAGLAMWRDNPLVGVGPGEFSTAIADYMPESGFLSVGNLTPHSLYVSLLAQTGAVGFLLFVGMMSVGISRAWRSFLVSGGTSPATAWGLALGIMALGALLKDESAEKLLWLTVGVAAASSAPAPSPSVRRSRSHAPTSR